MKIEVSIRDGSMEEQQRVTAFIYKSLNALREKQRQNGEACVSYEIKTSACRGVISVGWREDIEAAKQPKADLRTELMVQTYEALSSTIEKLCGSPTRSNELCQSLRVLSEVLRALGQMDGQETSR